MSEFFGLFGVLFTLTVSRILYGAFSEYCKHKNKLMAEVLWKFTKWTAVVVTALGVFALISYWAVEGLYSWLPEKQALPATIVYFALWVRAGCSVLEEVL